MILLTGATGFLGKYLADEFLAAGYELRVLVRNAATRQLPWGNLVDVADGDVLDVVALEKAMEGVEYVVHAAAMVSFWRKQREELMKINVEGTANVVNICLEAGIQKLVHVSSIGAVGRTNDGSPINEDTIWKPEHAKSGYALSKYRAEMEVYRGITEGLNAVMVNPGVIIGAGDWTQGPPKMFAVVNKGLRFYPDGTTGIVAATDVARATRLVMETDLSPGERYILVAENMTFRELFEKIARHLGKTPPRWKLPNGLSLAVGRVSEIISRINGRPPIVSLESMRSSTHARTFDGSKIQRLGFDYTPMEEVFAAVVKQFGGEITA
ncbi:MAG: NAD-dependent epimerase/dehydratase family protein [Bacteroidia bacterium]|nr:NAD-dependent epimerase/dehydratase family protein [Bacteroidia bacterium]